MLRKEYIQQKQKGTIGMGLFTFMPVVQSAHFYIYLDYIDLRSNKVKKKKRCKKETVDW